MGAPSTSPSHHDPRPPPPPDNRQLLAALATGNFRRLRPGSHGRLTNGPLALLENSEDVFGAWRCLTCLIIGPSAGALLRTCRHRQVPSTRASRGRSGS